MTNFEYERLHHNLNLLKLGTIESILDNYLEIAAKENKSTIEILDYLVEQESRRVGLWLLERERRVFLWRKS